MKRLRSRLAAAALLTAGADTRAADPVRVGVIGLDTSHAIEFTASFNTPKPGVPDYGCKVVAAYPQGSRDIASSVSRVPKYTAEMKTMGVEIVDSIDALLTKVDVVLLETNDGRPHLEQLRPCLKAKKPVFIDKPVAASLADVITIFEEAKAAGVPVFSASGLRYGKLAQEIRQGSLGKVLKAEAGSPAHLEPTHPDLFWYGIHGIEPLVTMMGSGAEKVKRGTTPAGRIEVTVTWKDGRTGIFHEIDGYSVSVSAEKGTAESKKFEGYEPLVAKIATFFHDRKPPVSAEETIEIYAIMEAADESKRQGGAEVSVPEVLAKAKAPRK